jgi:L-arabinose isomerase
MAPTHLDQLELWLVAGSQGLYGDETLRQVADQSRQVAAALDDAPSIPVRVVWREVATTAEAIRRLCLDANAADECVGLVAWMHTFSPAKMWIAGLGALQKPQLHLHTQFAAALPWAGLDMDFMNLNQSAHGDREFAHVQTRMGVARKVVAGHWSDPAVVDRIGAWSRAAAGLREARRLRVVRLGDNMRSVAVTEGDKVEAQIQLGFSVDGYGVSDLIEPLAAVGDAAIGALVDEYEDAYRVAPELRRGGDRHDALREAARIELALLAFLREREAGAFTTTFEDLGPLRQLPGIAVQRLMADGYGFGAEGDWKTAAMLRVLKQMAAGLDGGTSFMEDYTYHLAPGDGCILGAHMLEVCPSIADGQPSCEIHPLDIGGREDPVRLVFTAAPGPAVVLGLLDLGDRLRLVTNEIDVVTPEHDLPRLPVARALWRPRPDLVTSAESWLLAGGPHHTVFSSALGIEPLVDFAEMTRTELVQIDETTTLRDVKRELRWNQAYHHLARGL